MSDAVLLPCKFNPGSTVFSNQIASFLATALGIDFIHEGFPSLWKKQYDTLYVINYPFAFCGMADAVAELVSKAKRVVWVENDYTIVPPRTNHTGPKSPIRLAFGNRKDPLVYWTNRPDHAADTGGAYINWNMLAYQPLEKERPYSKRVWTPVYYGSFRQGRVNSFNRFLGPNVIVACSTRTSKKFMKYGGPIVDQLQPMIGGLAEYAATLYLEDDDTHQHYHSPANRFYEALAAGTALLVDRECLRTFRTAGISLDTDWVVSKPRDWQDLDLENVAWLQSISLKQDFHKLLVKQVKEAVSKL